MTSEIARTAWLRTMSELITNARYMGFDRKELLLWFIDRFGSHQYVLVDKKTRRVVTKNE